MALNELLIISIQTRLKGSLLIGHHKQEPLLMLHNCPQASPAPLLRGVQWGDALGWWVSPAGSASLGLCVPGWGCVCLSRVVHTCLELCMRVWGCTCPSGVVCSSLGLCMPVWACACLCGVVHACMGLWLLVQSCVHPRKAVRAHLGLCVPVGGCAHLDMVVCACVGICACAGCVCVCAGLCTLM